MSNSSVWPIDRTLSGATILSQSGLGSNGNERVLCIFQSSSITGASPSNRLMSYQGHSLKWGLPLCRDAVGVFYSPNQLGWYSDWNMIVTTIKMRILVWIYQCIVIIILYIPGEVIQINPGKKLNSVYIFWKC